MVRRLCSAGILHHKSDPVCFYWMTWNLITALIWSKKLVCCLHDHLSNWLTKEIKLWSYFWLYVMCHLSLALQLIILWLKILWEYQIMGVALHPFCLVPYTGSTLSSWGVKVWVDMEQSFRVAVQFEEQSDKYMAEWGASISPHKCVLSSQQRCSTSAKQWHIVSHNSAPLLFIHTPQHPASLTPPWFLPFTNCFWLYSFH